MTHRSLKLGAIALILTATAACTKPNSGNNNASMDANATTPPPADENAMLESGNNVTNSAANEMSGNNVTTSSGNNVTN